MKCQATPVARVHLRMAFAVNSVPRSLTVDGRRAAPRGPPVRAPHAALRSMSRPRPRGIPWSRRPPRSRHAQTPPGDELVVHEIDGPARVRQGVDEDRRPGPRRLLAPLPPAHRRLFFALEPLGLLAVHHEVLRAQQHVERAAAEPSAFACHLARPVAAPCIVRTPSAVADRRPIHADQVTINPIG